MKQSEWGKYSACSEHKEKRMNYYNYKLAILVVILGLIILWRTLT